MREFLINEYIQNFNVRLSTVDYVECSTTWKQENYLSPNSAMGYIKEGEGYFMIEDDMFCPKPGQMYLLPEQYHHSFSVTQLDNTFKKYYCHFNSMPGSFNIFKAIKLPSQVTPQDPEYVEYLFQQMKKILQDRISDMGYLKAKSILYQIFAIYYESCEVNQIEIIHQPKQTDLGEVLEFIEANLNQKITLQDASKQFGYNPQYFSRLFKRTFNLTFVQYTNQLKMDKARYLIRNSQLTVSEIADQLGFENTYYFSNTFKKHNGMAPTCYRNIYKSIK